MKHFITTLLLLLSVKSFAFVVCETKGQTIDGQPAFLVNLLHTDKIQAVVIDRRDSSVPKSYICQKESGSIDGSVVSVYSCFGGGMNEDHQIGFFIDETKGRGSYLNAVNEELDIMDGLSCEVE